MKKDKERERSGLQDFFRPSENCWQVKTAGRASLLVDGEAYFQALHEALRQARRTVFIVGWDLHSGVRLIRNGEQSDYPETLGKFLDYLARQQKGLDIFLLSWDFAMIYALEREFFPRYRLTWRTHKKIHFRLDGAHPIGGSQHQKLVVIDDALAFSGGMDLSKWRWDTSAHRPDDPRRVDPDGKAYPPFHDVQMVVDGAAAAALGQLARERWRRAGGGFGTMGEQQSAGDLWPDSVKPDFCQVPIAISRTMPLYREYPEIREVERLFIDMIGVARKTIYIENQYLSSHRLGEALKSSLDKDAGPEIVIVMPERTGGWLEQHTMDVLRGRILRTLRQADHYDRLRVYFPRLADRPPTSLMVHAKVMVIDDRLVRVGSANLSNRSLGLDSECDLAIVAREDSEDLIAIGGFRNRLLAEHLDVSVAEVAEQLDRHDSLIKAIETLRDDERSLVPLDGRIAEDIDQLVPEYQLLDPEQPIEPEGLLDYFVEPKQQRPAYRHLLKTIALIATVLGLAVLWRWTPLNDWVDIETVKSIAAWLKGESFTPLLVLAAFVVGGLVAFPVTLMVIGTLIVFGSWWGFVYAFVGAQVSALFMFYLARLLGRDTVDRIAGSMVNRLNSRLTNAGVLAVIGVRIIPVAPFSLINLVAGVSQLRWRDFVLGTLLGMLPGITALAILTDRLSASLRNQDLVSYALLVGVIVAVGAGIAGLRFWLRKRSFKKEDQG